MQYVYLLLSILARLFIIDKWQYLLRGNPPSKRQQNVPTASNKPDIHTVMSARIHIGEKQVCQMNSFRLVSRYVHF